MHEKPRLPADFSRYLSIDNAEDRLSEAMTVAERITEAGITLRRNPDHAAIFADPPHTLTGPLKSLGYVAGWDARCYPSPVDGCDYINVPSGLPDGHPAAERGWFRYVAVVHPVDDAARIKMLSQGYGNPFIHHVTWAIEPPPREHETELEYAAAVIPFAVAARKWIGEALSQEPGSLIMALPSSVVQDPAFGDKLREWVGDLQAHEYQAEEMQGGGFLIQFFVLTGGRIEVALRVGTTQTFNPRSVHKISEDEISTVQN